MGRRILVVDDHPDVREILYQKLKHLGHEVLAVESAEEALGRIAEFRPAIVVTDVRMPGMGGIALIERVRGSVDNVDFIVVTGHGDMESTVRAMKAGAAEYLVKPIDLKQLERVVEHCLRDQERGRLMEEDRGEEKKEDRQIVVGSDPRMIDIYKMVGVLARNRATVLVRGETGSGKEMIARAIHLHSSCATQPFIAVNCTALTDSLLASELFGHVKGAFTGASGTRRGYFQLAGAGTIFLDEIGDTTPEFQSKLLRVLQERQFYPVGGEKPIATEARVIAATHQPMEALVENGYFRKDLYFRLKVVEISLPPLRERPGDIPILAEHLLAQIRERVGEDVRHITPEAMKRLTVHDWPGNVREVENVLTRACIMARGTSIEVEHLFLGMEGRQPAVGPDRVAVGESPAATARASGAGGAAAGAAGAAGASPAGAQSGVGARARAGAEEEYATVGGNGMEPLDEAIARHVVRALQQCGGDRSAAADLLGISRLRLSWILRRARSDRFPEEVESR
ncbi:MAG: sigma-54 dependent transcriptional regulator [Gemmatimonadota bacterium]